MSTGKTAPSKSPENQAEAISDFRAELESLLKEAQGISDGERLAITDISGNHEGEKQLMGELQNATSLTDQIALIKNLLKTLPQPKEPQNTDTNESKEYIKPKNSYQEKIINREYNFGKEEEMMDFLNYIEKNYNPHEFKKLHPNFGFYAFQGDEDSVLKANMKVVEKYVNLFGDAISLTEWRRFIEFNIRGSSFETKSDVIQSLSRIGDSISPKDNRAFISGAIEYNYSQKNKENIKNKMEYFQKEGSESLKSIATNILERIKLLKETKDLDSLIQLLEKSNPEEKKKGKEGINAYFLENRSLDKISDNNINTIAKHMELAELPVIQKLIAEGLGQDTESTKHKIFRAFLREKGPRILDDMLFVNVKPHLEIVFDEFGNDAEKMNTVYTFLTTNLMLIFDYTQGINYFRSHFIKFMQMVDKSSMSDTEKRNLIQQPLFVKTLKALKPFEDREDAQFKKLLEKYDVTDQYDATSEAKKGFLDKAANLEAFEVTDDIKSKIDLPIKDLLEKLQINPEYSGEIKQTTIAYINNPKPHAILLFYKIEHVFLTKGKEANKEKIKKALSTFLGSIIQVKLKEIKKQEDVIKKGISQIPNENAPESIKENGVISLKKIHENFDKFMQNMDQNLSNESIIEAYLAQATFENFTEEHKETIKKGLRNYIGKKETQAEYKTREHMAEVIVGERSIDNLVMMQEQMLYFNMTTEEARLYADKTLGGPTGTNTNTVPKDTTPHSNLNNLATGSDPTPLTNLVPNGPYKGIDNYVVQKQSGGILQISNGDTKIIVPEEKVIAYISNISLLEEMGLGALVPNIDQINQIIARKYNKQISTQDGILSKEEIKSILSTFATILDINISQNDDIPKIITQFRNKKDIQGKSIIQEILKRKGILNQNYIFSEIGFKKNVL